MQYYSQYGQDKYLDEHIFRKQQGGFFLDIGAHDGISLSNSYFFEKNRQWNGICVEPLPNRFAELQANRACLAINACIAMKPGSMPMVSFDGFEDMLSYVEGSNPQHEKRVDRELAPSMVHRIEVKAIRLDDLLAENGIDTIDYCSIDVEGSELAVLHTLDLQKVAIRVFTIENNYRDRRIDWWMLLNGYRLAANLEKDQVFIKQQQNHLVLAVRMIKWGLLWPLRKVYGSLYSLTTGK